MKFLVLLIAMGAAATALANPDPENLKKVLESQPTCQTSVKYDDSNIFLGFGPYKRALENPRYPIPSKFRVAPLDGSPSYELPTLDSSIDFVSEGPRVFVLTYSGIEDWDLPSRERHALYPTYNNMGTLEQKEHAEAMARYKDKIIIAHGRLGVSFFDINQRKITHQFRLLEEQLPLESMATGVTVQGQLAYVVMDNYHLVAGPAIFRGIIVIDMEKESVVATHNILDPGIDSVVSNANTLIASYGGNPIWKYSIEGNKNTNPLLQGQVFKLPFKGHPTGHASMDEKYYYTCTMQPPAKKGGIFVNIPVALDRNIFF